MNLLQFLLTHQTSVFFAMFATLAFVGFVNLLYNPYAKQNAKFTVFCKRVLRKPSTILWETKKLPNEYQRQWRAFVNSHSTKPSVVFEFVKRPHKYLLWFAHFVACLVCLVYFAIAIVTCNQTMFATQVCFALFSVLIVLLSHLIAKYNLAQARRTFGRFLHNLNCVTQLVKGEQCANHPNTQVEPCQLCPKTSQDVAKPSQTEGPTQSTTSTPVAPTANQTPESMEQNNNDIVERAIHILRQKGLDTPRTVEEQRRLNIALNNLLQACCKK